MMTGLGKRYIRIILTITLVVLLGSIVTGCGDFGQFPPPTPTEVEKAPPPATISTGDRAVLVVYEYLLSRAESNKAKVYLADFYTICDNWTARSEVFKDGSKMWNVVVDMMHIKEWKERPYWQQASWFVLAGGKVIPSYRFQGSALRIEADLQALTLSQKQ